MSAEIIPFPGDLPLPDTGLTKTEASALIDASPWLRALERRVAESYGITPEQLRAGLLRNNREG